MIARKPRNFSPWVNKSDVADEAFAEDENNAIESSNEKNKREGKEGMMISVPGYYFTNGPWKKKHVGTATKTKHFVATNVGTKYNLEQKQTMYIMSIIGDHPDGDFEVKEKVFDEYRALWLSHGSLAVPYYDLGQVNIEQSIIGEEYVDKKKLKRTPKKRKRQREKGPTRTISDDMWNAWDVPEDVHIQIKDIINELCSSAAGDEPNKLLWTWASNSCHLDTFLAVELAFFGQYSAEIKASGKGTLCGDDDMGTKRLLKILLGAHERNRNKLRNEYWKMEIETDTYADSIDWSLVGSVLDHRSNVSSNMNANRMKWTRKLQVRKLFICTNEHHQDQERTGTKAEVPATVNWWPFPDKRINYIDPEDGREKCRIEPCLPITNENLRAVLMNLVARTDETKKICNLCKQADPSNQHYIHQICLAPHTKFPVSLVFAMEGFSGTARVPPEMKFTIGRTTYTLYAVMFSDGAHFHSTLLLNGNWYRYDDLGINRTIKDQLLTMIPASSFNDAQNGTHNCVVNFCPDLNCRFQEIHYMYLFVCRHGAVRMVLHPQRYY